MGVSFFQGNLQEFPVQPAPNPLGEICTDITTEWVYTSLEPPDSYLDPLAA